MYRFRYGEKVVSAKGPIPIHLLGHIHAQTWGSIADFMLPFPNRQSTDVTSSMVKQVKLLIINHKKILS
jgi:peptidyl-dipeptidase A